MEMRNCIVEARAVQKAYGAHPVLCGIDFQALRGERIALMGPSGAGKSTLLNCIGGIEPVDSGELRIDGTDLRSLDSDRIARLRREQIGTIFQFFHLLPTLTAAENIELPLQLIGLSREARRERVDVLLREVEMGHRASSLPRQLSGGEQQRVAIARALAVRPDLLLADEPTGSLDSKNAERILDLLERVSREHGIALIMVTHEASTTRICDRVVHLLDGRIDTQPGARP